MLSEIYCRLDLFSSVNVTFIPTRQSSAFMITTTVTDDTVGIMYKSYVVGVVFHRYI